MMQFVLQLGVCCLLIFNIQLVLGSEPGRHCYAKGDVHYRTYDNWKWIDVQGTCMHTMTRPCCVDSCPAPQPDGPPCVNDKPLPNFHVMAQHYKTAPSNTVSYVDFVAIELCNSGYYVTLKPRNPAGNYWTIHTYGSCGQRPILSDTNKASGTITCTGYSGSAPGSPHSFRIDPCGSECLRLTTSYGLRVYAKRHFAYVYVPAIYNGKMCGICGNNDGNPANDLVTRGGRDVTLLADAGMALPTSLGDSLIGNSWVVSGCPSCQQWPLSSIPPVTSGYTGKALGLCDQRVGRQRWCSSAAKTEARDMCVRDTAYTLQFECKARRGAKLSASSRKKQEKRCLLSATTEAALDGALGEVC